MIGKQIGRYVLEEELGVGGMGTVYRATDTRLDRSVAIKVLSSALLANVETQEQIRQEALVLSRLNHPNIGTVFDFDTVDGLSILVMEYIPGITLDARLTDGPVPEQEVLDLARQLTSGLDAAHSAGVIHRDLKPGNLRLTPDGFLKIIDFGLAKLHVPVSETVKTIQIMDTEGVSGTLPYMSPEQLRGEDVDARTDVYSAGVVLYELATGRRPFPEGTQAVLVDGILNREPQAPHALNPKLSPGTSRTILHAMAKDPANRPQSVGMLEAELAAGGPRKGFPRRVAMWIGASVIGLAALGFGASSWFGRESAEAMTTTVAVTTEDGEQVERAVPKAEHRKRVVLFFQDAEDTNADLEWLRAGFSTLVATDLSQDPFLEIRIPFQFIPDLEERGYPDGHGVPRSMQRQLTEEQHADYFIAGSVARDEAGYLMTVTLNATEGGEVSSHLYHGPDPFSLADQASVQLRLDMGIPREIVDTGNDFPVSDMMTESVPAFRAYMEGAMLTAFEKDHVGAKAKVESALAQDSTFTYAYMLDHIMATFLQDVPGARASLQKAVDYLYRIPERSQFKIRAAYYADIKEDPEKVLAVLRMWETLYPEDLEAVKTLAGYLELRGYEEEAREKCRRALEIDPDAYDMVLRLGDLQREAGAYDLAKDRFEQYVARFPQELTGYRRLAALSLIQGNLDETEGYYEQALLIDMSDIGLRLDRIELDVRRGDFADAEARYEEVLADAKVPAQRRDVLGSQRRLAYLRGQTQRSLEILDLRLIETDKLGNPFMAMGDRAGSMRLYAEAGEAELALQTLADLRSRTAPEYGAIVSMGESMVYAILGEPDSAAVHLGHLRDFMARFGVAAFDPVAAELEAGIMELRGQYDQAVSLFAEALESDPVDGPLQRDLGRVLRKSGDTRRSREVLEKAIRLSPSDARARVELAKTLVDMGEDSAALEQLDMALEIWAEADPDFADRIEARDLHESVKSAL